MQVHITDTGHAPAARTNVKRNLRKSAHFLNLFMRNFGGEGRKGKGKEKERKGKERKGKGICFRLKSLKLKLLPAYAPVYSKIRFRSFYNSHAMACNIANTADC